MKIVVVYPKSYDTRKPEEIEQGAFEGRHRMDSDA